MRPRKRDDRSHARKKRQITVCVRDGVSVIQLGEANVWDYGDLVRLRETASALISEGRRRIGIDLSNVGCLPSGFMNMLCEWQERGLKVYVFEPRDNVRDMLWFQTFTKRVSATRYRISCIDEKQFPAGGHWDDVGSGDDIPETCDVWS